MVKLTPAEVQKIATLARLTLTDKEVVLYQQQLGEVLNYIETLSEVDVTDVPITSQVTGLTTVLADDAVVPSLPVETLLANVPARLDSSIKVRAVFGGEA